MYWRKYNDDCCESLADQERSAINGNKAQTEQEAGAMQQVQAQQQLFIRQSVQWQEQPTTEY